MPMATTTSFCGSRRHRQENHQHNCQSEEREGREREGGREGQEV